MENFTPQGHLTLQALQSLCAGTLSEMERLEVSEHLSFCDECLGRYMALLTDDVLQSPPKPMAQTVLRTARRRLWKNRLMHYAAVGVAACLTVLIWGVSSFLLPQWKNSRHESAVVNIGQYDAAAAEPEATAETPMGADRVLSDEIVDENTAAGAEEILRYGALLQNNTAPLPKEACLPEPQQAQLPRPGNEQAPQQIDEQAFFDALPQVQNRAAQPLYRNRDAVFDRNEAEEYSTTTGAAQG